MKRQEQTINEERTVEASYIINFYRDIMVMNDQGIAYQNLILEFDKRYSKEYIAKASAEEKVLIMQTVQSLRFYARKVYIEYTAIMKGLKQPNKKEIDELYEKVKNEIIINVDDIEKYLIELNSFITEDIIKNLLETSQDIIDKMFKNADTITKEE